MYKTLSRNIQRGQLRRALASPSRKEGVGPKKPKRITSDYSGYGEKKRKKKPPTIKGPVSDGIRLKHFDRIRTLTSLSELGSNLGPAWLEAEIRRAGLKNWVKRVGRLRLKSSPRPRRRRVEIAVNGRHTIPSATQSVRKDAPSNQRSGEALARRLNVLDLVQSGFLSAVPAWVRTEIDAVGGAAAWIRKRAAEMTAKPGAAVKVMRPRGRRQRSNR